jgi:hypothetical protein
MKDSDFDKIFAGKFSRLAGATYREENWRELSYQLDAYGRWRQWLLPVLIPLLALLAAGNIFWWFQWREVNAQKKISENQTVIIQRDTIIHTTTVYRFDTVFLTDTRVFSTRAQSLNSVRLPSQSAVFMPSGRRIAGGQNIRQPLRSDTRASDGTIPGPPGLIPPADYATNTNAGRDAAIPITGSREGPDGIADTAGSVSQREIPELIDRDTIFQLSIPTPEPVKKAGSPAFFYIARPRLGFFAGWGTPPLSGVLSGPILKLGFSADVEVARNVRLGMCVGFDRAWIKSESTKAFDDDIVIPDPGQDFKLEYWKAQGLQTLSYTLQLQYTLPVGKTWSPRIGAGVQAATIFPFDLEFEFEDDDNDVEISLPFQNSTITRLQGMLMTLGLDVPLNRRTTLGLESYFLRRFDKKETFIDNQLGLRTTLFYNF